MNQRRIGPNGREPRLGDDRYGQHLTGLEPALGRGFGPLYGRFRLVGFEAPPVVGRRCPLVVLAELDDSAAELGRPLAASHGSDGRRTDNGLEAWRLARVLEPNLLVIDSFLPSLDGFEVIRRVRADLNPLVSRMPILVMDVRHGQQDVLKAFRSGADDYLEMPYDVRVLLRCWRRVVGDIRRPSPLTALLSEDAIVRQVALSYLLDTCPAGLVDGLHELMRHPDPAVRDVVDWALQRLRT